MGKIAAPAVSHQQPAPVNNNLETQPTMGEPALAPEVPAAADEPPAAFDPDHVEAVLVSVLDDLGAAHHRPFSRG